MTKRPEVCGVRGSLTSGESQGNLPPQRGGGGQTRRKEVKREDRRGMAGVAWRIKDA